MKKLFFKYTLLLLSIHVLTLIVPTVSVSGGLEGIMWAALIYLILDLFVRPILKILLFPVHILTLSLSMWIVDVVLFTVWTFISPSVSVGQGFIPGYSFLFIRFSPIHLVYWQSLVIAGVVFRILINFFEWIVD